MNPNFQNPNPQQQNLKKQEETMGFDKYVAVALIVGLIAGFIIGQSFDGKDGDNMKKSATSTNNIFVGGENATSSASTSSIKLGANTIGSIMNIEDVEVSDQKAGQSVVISSLNLDKSYWVAVRDNQDTTKNPYILGARRISAGDYKDITIRLSRATVAGKSYDIVFYKDSATFNYNASQLVMDGGKLKAATFKAN